MSHRVQFLVVLGALVLTSVPAAAQDAAVEAYKATVLSQKEAIAATIVDSPSTGAHCVIANEVGVHQLGVFPVNTTLMLRFQSTFDPVAMLLGTFLGFDAGEGRGLSHLVIVDSDDEGGNLEPLITIATPPEAEGSWTLHVADASLVPPLARPGGCYTYELTVTPVTTTETGLF